MIVKGTCPHCKKEIIMSVIVECLEEKAFTSEGEASRYILNNIIIRILVEHGVTVSKPIQTDEN